MHIVYETSKNCVKLSFQDFVCHSCGLQLFRKLVLCRKPLVDGCLVVAAVVVWLPPAQEVCYALQGSYKKLAFWLGKWWWKVFEEDKTFFSSSVNKFKLLLIVMMLSMFIKLMLVTMMMMETMMMGLTMMVIKRSVVVRLADSVTGVTIPPNGAKLCRKYAALYSKQYTNTNTQIHKYKYTHFMGPSFVANTPRTPHYTATNAQIQMQIHKCTNTNANTQIHKCTLFMGQVMSQVHLHTALETIQHVQCIVEA